VIDREKGVGGKAVLRLEIESRGRGERGE